MAAWRHGLGEQAGEIAAARNVFQNGHARLDTGEGQGVGGLAQIVDVGVGLGTARVGDSGADRSWNRHRLGRFGGFGGRLGVGGYALGGGKGAKREAGRRNKQFTQCVFSHIIC